MICDEYFEQALKPAVLRLFARRGVSEAEYKELLLELVQSAELVNPSGEAPPCRDETDRKYLHCAAFASVPWLVTRDPDLLDEDEQLPDTSIVKPEAFLALILASGRSLDE